MNKMSPAKSETGKLEGTLGEMPGHCEGEGGHLCQIKQETLSHVWPPENDRERLSLFLFPKSCKVSFHIVLFCCCGELRQWRRGNIALITTLPVLNCPMSKLGATPATQVSGSRFPPCSNKDKQEPLKHKSFPFNVYLLWQLDAAHALLWDQNHHLHDLFGKTLPHGFS